jgi:hypothetical protein
LLLTPISAEAPFMQWGLDFIGKINPPSSTQHKWILTTTDYFTKWIEEIPIKKSIDAVFPTSLGPHIKNLLQEKEAEPNSTQRIINHLIHMQQAREQMYNQSHIHQEKIKKDFDKNSKP